jgi:hypothetical protein
MTACAINLVKKMVACLTTASLDWVLELVLYLVKQ